MSYTTECRTVLINFPPDLRTNIIALKQSTGNKQGGWGFKIYALNNYDCNYLLYG